MNWFLFQNSLLVAVGATLLAVVFGVLAALGLAGLPRAWRTAGLALAIVALALPPFLVTNSWLHFLGPTGTWRSWLPFNVVSFAGTVWILSLLLWPISLLLVLGAWQRLEPEQLESDLAITGWHLFRGLLLPLAKPALVQAAVLTFVLALNNFAVPAILQVKTFPAEVWIRFSTSFDAIGSLVLSLPMMLAVLAVLLWLTRRGLPWPHLQASVSPSLFRRQLGALGFSFCFFFTAILLASSTVLPLAQILTVRRTWTELPGALAAGQSAIWNSFWLSALSATLAVLLSLAAGVAWVGRKPAKQFWSALPGLVLWVPFLVPGVLLGIGLISAFNRPWSALFYQSAGIVLFALVLRYSGFSWNTVAHSFQTADRDLIDAARVEGAGFWQTLRHAYWPQISPQVTAVWYVLFLLCLWDVESIILIIPPDIGETLALRIFNLLHYGHNAQVNALCLTLLALALAPLLFWTLWRQACRRLGPRSTVLAAHCAAVLLLGCLLAACQRRPESLLHSNLFADVKVIGTRGVGVGQLNKPRSVAVDAQDNLYVVDMTGRVQKFDSNGVFQLSWQMPQTDLGKPKGMCRDQEGNIVVIEPHYSRVNHYSPEGKLLLQWGMRGTNDGQLSVPRAAAVDSRNEIFVTEYLERERLQKFLLPAPESSAGISNHAPVWEASIGKAGNAPGEFNRPEGICVDSQDRVYVADSCNHRIEIFSSDGKLLRVYGKPGKGVGQLSYPYDVCVDHEGRQYVCEFGNSRIQVFDAQDRPIEIIGGRGSEPGRFSNPWGVALDSAGNLYVADSQNHRVQKLIRNSKSEIIRNPKSEIRNPKEIRSPKSEALITHADCSRRLHRVQALDEIPRLTCREDLRISFQRNAICALLRYSDFGLLSDFGFRISELNRFRHSDFGFRERSILTNA